MTQKLTFRQQLRAGHRLFGTFFKTPAYQLVEVLGGADLDFIVIDAEHASFDRAALDVCLLAARSSQLPALVRVQSTIESHILDALDLGASGIVAPHARNAECVRKIISAARYRDGSRGFSNSPRAGGYGTTSMQAHIAASDRDNAIVCQIEDREAVEDIHAIAAIDEADCLFIGRADLAVSYGTYDVEHPTVKTAVQIVCDAGKAKGKSVGIHVSSVKEMQTYLAMGVTMFIVSSEQAVLRTAFADMAQKFRSA